MANENIQKTALWLWTFLAPTILRGLMWILSGWLGMEASKASDTAQQLMAAGGAVFVAAIAAIWSWIQRRKALNTPCPEPDKK
jgi:hypothetical protein